MEVHVIYHSKGRLPGQALQEMKFLDLSFGQKLLLAAVSYFVLPSAVKAQIIGDETLPVNSDVSQNGSTIFVRDGTQVGNNLFHSFSEFSLGRGIEVRFENSDITERIVGRVTGSSASRIDGLIRANGTADLFLINPQGIIFGEGAQLAIGGSFIGSTAESISFSDGTIFRATGEGTSLTPTPLLEVSVPVGLQLSPQSGSIRVEGLGNNVLFTTPQVIINEFLAEPGNGGLQVSEQGETLVLIGGDLNLDGGVLESEAGRIELAAIGEGTVELQPEPRGFSFGYESVSEFRDISLTNDALVAVSNSGEGIEEGGLIHLQGRRISLERNSLLLMQQEGIGETQGIFIDASRSLEIFGTLDFDPAGIDPETMMGDPLPGTAIFVNNLGERASGSIEVSVPKILLENSAFIFSDTSGTGNSGAIRIQSQSLELNGLDSQNQTGITARTLGPGDAGDIFIATETLLLVDGGLVASIEVLVPEVTGFSGTIEIEATDIRIEGKTSSVLSPSPSMISTSSVTTTDGFSEGSGGDIIIQAASLELQDEGAITTSTFGLRSAGNILIEASDLIELAGEGQPITVPINGEDMVFTFPTTINSQAGPFAVVTPSLPPSGDGGQVTINAPLVNISDGAQISVSNTGSGDGGVLNVNAENVMLDNLNAISDGSKNILASAASGQGGEINLNVDEQLLLQNGAGISATAGNAGDGGNVAIAAELIVAFPQENSDISASAEFGNGGNVTLQTEGLFGLSLRDTDTALSDITVTSELGIDGELTIESPEIDPQSSLVVLPENLTDPANLIATGCTAEENADFVLAGPGGLPADPTAPLQAQSLWQDLREPGATTATDEDRPQPQIVPLETPQRLVEAQGWSIDGNGRVVLLASAGKAPLQQPRCQQLQAANLAR